MLVLLQNFQKKKIKTTMFDCSQHKLLILLCMLPFGPYKKKQTESKMLLLSYIREDEGRPEVLRDYEKQISRGTTPIPAFQWPPKLPSEEDDRIALAAPIYRPPPETQRIQPKSKADQPPTLPPSAQKNFDPQSMSAPNLSRRRTSSFAEQPEIYSDSSNATSSSTEDSSEEYQMYSTNVSQPLVKYYPDNRPELDYQPVLDYPSNYSAILRHKPSICSVKDMAENFVDDQSLNEMEEQYFVQEPITPSENNARKERRVLFDVPPQKVYAREDREDSVEREITKPLPISVEGRHGSLYEFQFYDRGDSDYQQQQYDDSDRRQSYEVSYDSRRESEVIEDKTIPFIQQYCTGETRYELPKIEETKPAPLPQSHACNTFPQQWQSQMLKALIVAPKEVDPEYEDPFEKARQAAYDQQIEDDKKARDNERRKLMDEMLAKQRAMKERLERQENELAEHARKFTPVSQLVPHKPDDWRPPQQTPTIPLPEEKKAYLPPPPNMEPIHIGPLSFPRTESPLLGALKIAPIRPYTPFSGEVPSQMYDMPIPIQSMSFSSALVTAPDRPFTPYNEVRDFSLQPTDTIFSEEDIVPKQIYSENQEKIRYLEEIVDKQPQRRGSAFAKIRPVKPATPVQERRQSKSNGRQPVACPFSDDEQLPEEERVPIVCVPQECIQTYQTMCSVQQKPYQSDKNTLQVDAQVVRKPPQTPLRTPSPRRAQGQVSPALLKPDPAGLHKADQIPGYQRKWFNLPTQRASITPEPQELKQNVPLAFVSAPKQPSPTISKPIAISAANTYTTSVASSSNTFQPSNSRRSSAQYNGCYSYESQMQQNGSCHSQTCCPCPTQQAQPLRAIEPRYSISSVDSQAYYNQTMSQQRPLLAIEPRYSIAEFQPNQEVEEYKAPVSEGKRQSRASISQQQQTQVTRRSFAEAQSLQNTASQSNSRRGSNTNSNQDTQRASITSQSSSRRTSQAKSSQEQLVKQEQTSRRNSLTASQNEQRRGTLEQTPQTSMQKDNQELASIQKEHDSAPAIRIVEPRWRTPSRQYLHEFSEQSSRFIGSEAFSGDPTENLRPVTPSSRPRTPSRAHPRATQIPYYQEQLAWDEGVALSKEFERKFHTPSPNSLMCRPKSPAVAFGPPPNPLKLIHPQLRDEAKDLSGKYLSGIKLLSPMWEQGHHTGADNQNYEKSSQSESQQYQETPETVQRQRIGDTSIETRQRESRLDQQKKAEMEKSSTEQIGNTQIQRRTRVVEEFEHTQSAKSIEIQKTTGATLTIQDNSFPPKGFVANQARRLSTADSDISASLPGKRQFIGGGQEPRESFHSQEQPKQSINCSQMQSYCSQSQKQTKSAQISQCSVSDSSCNAPPPGFPISTKAIQPQLQQEQLFPSTASITYPNNIGTTKPPLPPATNTELYNNNNNYNPSSSTCNNNPTSKTSSDPVPGLGGISGKPYSVQGVTQPKRGRGILNQAVGPSARSPLCGCCNMQVRCEMYLNI